MGKCKIETIKETNIENLKEKAIDNINALAESSYNYNDGTWKPAFADDRTPEFASHVKAVLYSGSFTLPALKENETVTFFYDSLGTEQSIYINGKSVAVAFKERNRNGYKLDAIMFALHKGDNSIVIMASPFVKEHSWSSINTNPGLIQILTPAPAYKRKLFNGLAQVIIQSSGAAGEIILTATGKDIKPYSLKINAAAAGQIPSVK